jgi:hypothetical protein
MQLHIQGERPHCPSAPRREVQLAQPSIRQLLSADRCWTELHEAAAERRSGACHQLLHPAPVAAARSCIEAAGSAQTGQEPSKGMESKLRRDAVRRSSRIEAPWRTVQRSTLFACRISMLYRYSSVGGNRRARRACMSVAMAFPAFRREGGV